MITLILGSHADYAAWAKTRGITSAIAARVRHIPDLQTARGLGYLPGYTIIILPSADPALIFSLQEAGFHVPKSPQQTQQIERQRQVAEWTDRLCRWAKQKKAIA